MAYDDARSYRPKVNLNYDNLAEVKRQVELAQKRIREGKTWLGEEHLRKALFHLETHGVQKAERKRLGLGMLE